MLLNFVKSNIEILKRHGGFTAINVIGLTLGISSCLLIILYVNFELGFEKFHKNEANIYRVVMDQPGNQVVGSTSSWWVVSPYILKPTWERELPEIRLCTRTTERNWSFKLNDQYIAEDVMAVDPEFFDIFTYPVISDNEKEILVRPYSIVISQKVADKYFGQEDPIGKTLVINDGTSFQVTGVLNKTPENTHLKLNILVSFLTIEAMNDGKSLLTNNWLNNSYRTYLLLNENVNLDELDAKLRKYDIDGFNGKKWSFHLQPLADIHFNRQIRGTGNKDTLFIFISIGLFILFIAGFNYMNLYIAHYRARTKNIGIRKIYGASRMQLITHFLGESFLLVFLSYLVSVAFVWLVLPWFSIFIGNPLEFKSLWSFNVIVASICTILIMSLVAGAYPAFYLSGLRIITGIKGGMEKFSSFAMFFRKGIIVVQFSVSIILLIGTITVYRQLFYTTHKSVGYNRDLILYIILEGIWYQDSDGEWKNRSEMLKQDLLKNSNVIKVSGSSGVPTEIGWSNIPTWEGQPEGDNPFFYRLNVDADFLELYGLEIIQGRGFSMNLTGEYGKVFILNEAAVKALDLKSPVGVRFGFDKNPGTIIGVVKDFHFESIHKPITPLGIGFTGYEGFNYLSVKISNNDISRTIAYITKCWAKLSNNTAIKYSFIDDQLNHLYQKDQQLSEALNYFSFIALFISCLGIFGIISFSIKERTKELGIRKVLGASVPVLYGLLLKDIFLIIGLSSLAGGILGWHVTRLWLNNFAYRIDFSFDIILISFVIALLMAMIPVCFKLWKSIRTNPVESLRTE
jgi:putative ABC transport system permease protein